VQTILCCSFSIIQGARVEISMDASNFTPLIRNISPWNQVAYNKWDSCINIFSLPSMISAGCSLVYFTNEKALIWTKSGKKEPTN
jgi:hypothetical protein